MAIITYLSLNVCFMACMWLVLRRVYREPRSVPKKLLLHLLPLTAVFDSLIIAANIVAYDTDKILGLRIGMAPIEDFCYTLAVVYVVPALWKLTERKHTHDAKDS